MGVDPDHSPLPSMSFISKTFGPPLGPGTAPELLFERKKRADKASDAHMATETVSWDDDGRVKRFVDAEKVEMELRVIFCWA